MIPLKILAVDDEFGIRKGISRILNTFSVDFPFLEEAFNYEVIEVETGEKALEILVSEKIDIVLLDNQLPGIHGTEVLQQINEMSYDCAVMMITSYASLDLAVEATNKGAFNFVPKPFTPQELRDAVESITKHLYLKRMTRKMNEEGRETRFQFLSVLSHELKSPINAVEGYLRIMQEKQVGDNIDDYKTMINRSLERLKGMRGLIFDLLDFTRIESGKKKRNLQKTDIVQLAKMALDSIEPAANQKKIQIFRDFPEEMILTVDSGEFEIIFNNLLSNAIKYNVQEGKVFFTISSHPGFLQISVKDTGIGMNADETAALFKDFVRIKNEKTKNITGSGLGLSIMKKIIELYGGTIDVFSEPEKGTEFRIEIPFH